MIKIKLAYLIVFLLMLASLGNAVKYDLSPKEVIFNSASDTKQVIIETDTAPLFVSVSKSSEIKDIISIHPNLDLKVTKDKPLILTITNKQDNNFNGRITLNFLYETLPNNINYLGDDTIIIPVSYQGNTISNNNIHIKLTEDLPPGETSGAVSLGANVYLPIIAIIIILILFKKKWRK